MSKEEKRLNATTKALAAINAALEGIAFELKKVPEQQEISHFTLKKFELVLKNMLKKISLGNEGKNIRLIPGMSRIITDEWPYDVVLGELIQTADHAFWELEKYYDW